MVASVAGIGGEIPVLVVSVRTELGLDDVRELLGPGVTGALLGPSGAGQVHAHQRTRRRRALWRQPRFAPTVPGATRPRGASSCSFRAEGFSSTTPACARCTCGSQTTGCRCAFDDIAELARTLSLLRLPARDRAGMRCSGGARGRPTRARSLGALPGVRARARRARGAARARRARSREARPTGHVACYPVATRGLEPLSQNPVEMSLEPISPELALVDPDLAARARAVFARSRPGERIARRRRDSDASAAGPPTRASPVSVLGSRDRGDVAPRPRDHDRRRSDPARAGQAARRSRRTTTSRSASPPPDKTPRRTVRTGRALSQAVPLASAAATIRLPRGYSSVGRAPGSHPGGRRFEPG